MAGESVFVAASVLTVSLPMNAPKFKGMPRRNQDASDPYLRHMVLNLSELLMPTTLT
jgi:hypothetical protein